MLEDGCQIQSYSFLFSAGRWYWQDMLVQLDIKKSSICTILIRPFDFNLTFNLPFQDLIRSSNKMFNYLSGVQEVEEKSREEEFAEYLEDLLL